LTMVVVVMKLTRLLLCLAVAWGLLVFPCGAADYSARQLVDHLYIVDGQFPIQTLIVEMEASSLIGQDKDGVGNLAPASKDKIFFKKPNKLHVDSIMIDPGGPFDGKQFTIVRDGVNRWMFVSMGQYPVKKGADEPKPTSWLPFNLQVYPQDAHKQYTVVGTDKVSFGVPTEVVRIVDPNAPKAPIKVWIDRVRWVPLCQDIIRPGTRPGEADSLKRVLYKDIRKLPDGRYFPFLIEWYEGGVLTSAGVYKSVGINENLPDNLFEPMRGFFK